MDKKKTKEVFERLNSRVPGYQKAFIKKEADKKGVGEAAMSRIIIDFYMSKHK